MKLWLGLAAAAVIACAFWLRPSEPSAETSWTAVATTYSPGPRGAKALYLLLGQLGLETARLRRPSYDRLDPNVTLWDLADGPLGPLERRWLLAFVRRGGSFVAAPRALGRLLGEAGLGDPIFHEEGEGPIAGSKERLSVKPFDGPALELERWQAVIGLSKPETLFAADAKGRPIAAAWRVGRGRLVFLGLVDAARNDQIGNGGNGVFFARLAGDLGGRQLFDEFQAGFGDATPWRLLTQLPYRWGLLQLALAILAGLVWLVPRRLPVEPPAQLRRRRTVDQIDAVARLWASGGDAGLPLGALLGAAEQRARARLGTAEAIGRSPASSSFVAWVALARPEFEGRARELWARASSLAAEPPLGEAEVLGAKPSIEGARRSAVALAELEREVVAW